MELTDKMEEFVPIENLIKMNHLEQYVYRVVNVTSRYNTSTSYYYSSVNLVGKYVKYPSYGDFPETYFLRSYGNWWKKSEAYQFNYRPQDMDPLGAEDYITLEFESPVVPRDICVYEVYNPGALVRIWGNILSCGDQTRSPWFLLWEGPPQICPHESRKFHPPITKINWLINTIRLEFNQSHLQYHYSIDAVLLAGHQPVTNLQCHLIQHGLIAGFRNQIENSHSKDDSCDADDNEDLFACLPYEVIIHIFQYLDLKSLSRCAQVNKTWNEASTDPVLYQNISLKPYWHLVNCGALEYFINKCKTLKRLDLSWWGDELVIGFSDWVIKFIKKHGNSLTHLSMSNRVTKGKEVMLEVSKCKELIDLRLKNLEPWLASRCLENLHKLVSVDFSSTHINDNDLISVLKANPHMKHIIIDLCENLVRMDEVVETVEKYNKHLTTWSSWKTFSLSVDGIKKFANCHHLKELDLGWCLMNRDPGDCMEYIANGCTQLKRLILSEWRGLNDNLLMCIITACKELTQLDLLGIKNISADFCEKVLLMLPKLRLLDISFCELIRQEEVEYWRYQYPHITIQRSCQYVVNDYLN